MDRLSNTDHETAVCWNFELRGRSNTPARRPAQQNQENTRIKRQPLWLEKRQQ
jgi:hypothetical protein